MSRYIDADALIDDLIHNRSFYPALVASAIKNTPTADVVEVVRCEDCKHAEIPLNGVFGDKGKRICVRLGKLYLPCEFYCQHGERRANDGT
jgi:hypothetical protein